MRSGLPSVTAVFVAAARALASDSTAAQCDPGDSMARALLPRPVNRVLSALQRSSHVAPWLSETVALASFGLVDHLAFRSRALDRALESAVARGFDQVVVLGAGLDTRAHRLGSLQAATVYEVDHPDTQAHKRARAASLPMQAGSLRYVPVDFTRDSLSLQLAAHGQDATRRTFWIWEGVVPYLEDAAIRSTLQAVAERSASGSELATTYVTPGLIWMRRAKRAVSFGMQVIGEPVQSLIAREEFAHLLEHVGFETLSDTNTASWREDFAERRRRGVAINYERLSLSRKR